MSTFQDLYAHAAADRERAMQFAVIKDIRRRAVREMMEDGVYIEPENPDEMTEEEHAARQAESAYAYGLRSIIDVRVLEEEDGNPAYATAVRNSATKPFCIALCLQTKLEELLVNGAISPRMAVQRRKYRLRFLNASNARSYALRLGGGRPMTQIAGDGGPLF